MLGFLKRLFGKKHVPSELDEKAAEQWYAEKSSMMESLLGKEHEMVMHALIPFAIGGGLDLYYYPNAVPGTAIATKELCELPNEGPSNKKFSCYELVMFTRHALDMDAAKDEQQPFGRAHKNMNMILNLIARYAQQASLNPNETCEFPAEMEGVGGKCLVFDSFGSRSNAAVRSFGLLSVMEVFRSEMQYARENGTDKLLDMLKAAGHYPYSDMDREAVV